MPDDNARAAPFDQTSTPDTPPRTVMPDDAPSHATIALRTPPRAAAHQSTPSDAVVSHDTRLPNPVTIVAEDALSIDQAVALAHADGYDIPKSTLQRRAKRWRELHEIGQPSPVKSMMITLPSVGNVIRIDREGFLAWVFDQKNNNTSPRLTPHIDAPHETSRDTAQQGSPIATDDKYLMQLERENDMLHKQLQTKDQQIDNLTRLSEATLNNVTQQNTLMQGFQKMLTGVAFLGSPKAPEPAREQPTRIDAAIDGGNRG